MTMGKLIGERHVSVILFEGFEVLDVFGPVELLSQVPDMHISFLGKEKEPVQSAQGVRVLTDLPYTNLENPDILLIPGGAGTRTLVQDTTFLSWLKETGQRAEIVASVCTGSALLAAAGLLKGRRATSNKRAFGWVSSLDDDVEWQSQARWVEDGKIWTSSGVAAGLDMTASLIQHLFGAEAFEEATTLAEYQPQTDITVDPFADIHGLI